MSEFIQKLNEKIEDIFTPVKPQFNRFLPLSWKMDNNEPSLYISNPWNGVMRTLHETRVQLENEHPELKDVKAR